MTAPIRSVALCALLLTLLACGDSALEQRAAATCAAVESERFEEALALSTSGAGPIGAGRELAECRCIAFLSLGDRDGCTALLGPLLVAPEAADWVPHRVLAKLMLRTWQQAGVGEPAAALAARAAIAYRDDLDLLQLELALRGPLGDESALLDEIEARLGPDPEWIPQRIVLALARSRRGEHEAVLRVLGERAPSLEHPLATPWYESRIRGQAALGDLAAVQQTFARWREAGQDPIDLAARYALRLSTDQLVDPERSTIDLLREAIATQDALRDRQIVWGLHRRLITELLANGQPEAALVAYDAAAAVVDLTGITRDEIERAVRHATEPPDLRREATLVFSIPSALAGGSLALSPGPDEPPDARYRVARVPSSGELVLPSPRGLHPRRWVLRDEAGRVRASGAVWPEPGRTTRITPVVAADARSPAHAAEPTAAKADRLAFEPAAGAPRAAGPSRRRPADGRRRVIAILPDCGDWRLVQYMRARGELPFHERLLSTGYRAVLESRPAFTAAALQSLVWPAAPRARTTLDWIHDLGLELAGLEAIGSNPLEWLAEVLPERPNLFETLGAADRVTANMLLAHGRIEAGRHAELVGPHGDHRSLAAQAAYRPFSASERKRFPDLDHDPDTRRLNETIAAEMDAAEQIVRAGEVDFLFLRLEALDLITHSHYGALDGRGQDDGRGPLLDSYRYIDARLEALDALLDRDDWLVYLSDHGIRSSMQHEEDAIFAVLGEGVPASRAPGTPALRGIPRTFATMFGVPTDWPRTLDPPWLASPTDSTQVAENR